MVLAWWWYDSHSLVTFLADSGIFFYLFFLFFTYAIIKNISKYFYICGKFPKSTNLLRLMLVLNSRFQSNNSLPGDFRNKIEILKMQRPSLKVWNSHRKTSGKFNFVSVFPSFEYIEAFLYSFLIWVICFMRSRIVKKIFSFGFIS